MAASARDLSCIKQRGWRQGSVLPRDLVVELVTDELLPDCDGNAVWMVLSHSCDLTHHRLDREQWIEVILLRAIEPRDVDGSYVATKNPRVLHLRDDAGKQAFEITISDRRMLPREKLVGHEPGESVVWPRAIREIAYWVARRYTREAFPDRFNDLCQKAFQRARSKLKSARIHLDGIYIQGDVSENVPEDQSYSFTLWGVVPMESYGAQDLRRKAQEAMNQLEVCLNNQKGLDVRGSILRSTSEVSLHDLGLLRRLDFDDLSVRDGDFPRTHPSSGV